MKFAPCEMITKNMCASAPNERHFSYIGLLLYVRYVMCCAHAQMVPKMRTISTTRGMQSLHFNNFKIDMIDGIQAGRQYLTRSVFNALSIGSGLVASVSLCMKRGDI